MARAKPRRRAARPAPAADGRRPRSPAPANSAWGPLRWWGRRSALSRVGLVAGAVLVVLIGANLWLRRQPPAPDVSTLHADVLAHRSGSEVTFTGTLVGYPSESGGHERMSVRDQLGDVLELDYNTSLGRWVPVHAGSTIVVHGQLYVDPGQAGVHCLHGQTSSGCPEPGWIQYAGSTYS